MGIWDDHDAWIEQLRGFLGDDSERLDDDDIMFVSNLAAEVMHGRTSLPGVLEEISKWVAGKSGMVLAPDAESFELEMAVNYPDLIEITERFKANMIFADEPGIADGIVRIWADPNFVEFVAETSTVAMTCKAWIDIGRLRPNEHATMGWAIFRAVQDANEE